MARTTHAVALALSILTAPLAQARGAGEATDASLAHCAAGESTSSAAALALATRGLALAEAAIAADPTDARAHFALFCNLGRQMHHQGVGLRAFAKVRRLRASIDRALTLRPDYPDALVGKAMLLMRLPRLLGGSEATARRLLEHALVIDPTHRRARAVLTHGGTGPADR